MTFCLALVGRATSGYEVEFPEFPGLSSSGATFSDAVRNGIRDFSLYIEGVEKASDLDGRICVPDESIGRLDESDSGKTIDVYLDGRKYSIMFVLVKESETS